MGNSIRKTLRHAAGLGLFFAAYAGSFVYLFRDGYHRRGFEYSAAFVIVYGGWFFGPWIGIFVGFFSSLLTVALIFAIGSQPDFSLALPGGMAGALLGFVSGKMGQWNKKLKDLVESEKSTRRQLAEEKRKAEEANRAKSAFLANMSHEIRTPMNVILGAAELLDREDPNPAQQEYIRVLSAAGRTLLALINDILDISRVEAERLDLESVDFDLGELLDNLRDTLGVVARQKDLKFTLEIQSQLPLRRRGDPTRVNQVLVNLIGNAVKFTENGFVRVDVEADSQFEDGILFRVADSGIGISPEKISMIFDAFTQADASMTRRYGGTGLGLALCRRLVDLMGGVIGVNSTPAQGSEFFCRIPLPLARTNGATDRERPERDASPAAEAPGAESAAIPVLLVEDNPDNRFLIQAFLKKTVYAVAFAVNGAEGLKRYAEEPYALVLMDLQMPVMDGYEALRSIRSLEVAENRRAIPIIALTASALPEERERCLRAGFDAHLAKPVGRGDLLRVLNEYAGRSMPG